MSTLSIVRLPILPLSLVTSNPGVTRSTRNPLTLSTLVYINTLMTQDVLDDPTQTPMARPEPVPAPPATGIDYLGLLAERHAAELDHNTPRTRFADLVGQAAVDHLHRRIRRRRSSRWVAPRSGQGPSAVAVLGPQHRHRGLDHHPRRRCWGTRRRPQPDHGVGVPRRARPADGHRGPTRMGTAPPIDAPTQRPHPNNQALRSLAVAAIGAGPDRLLQDLNYFGFVFGPLVVRDLRILTQPLGGTVLHYRQQGLEIDVIVELTGGRWRRSRSSRSSRRRRGEPAALGVMTATRYGYKRATESRSSRSARVTPDPSRHRADRHWNTIAALAHPTRPCHTETASRTTPRRTDACA